MSYLIISWDFNIIILSYVLSFVGSYQFVCFVEQYRICNLSKFFLLNRTILFVTTFLSLSVLTVWSTHILILSSTLSDHPITSPANDHPTYSINILIEISLLILSIILAVMAIRLASKDRVYTKSIRAFEEMIALDAKTYIFEDIRVSMSKKKALNSLKLDKIGCLVRFKGPIPILCSGILISASVSIVHILGLMFAIVPNDNFNMERRWNMGILFGAILLCTIGCILSVWMAYRLLPLFRRFHSLRIIASLVLSTTVVTSQILCTLSVTYDDADNSNQHSTTNNDHDTHNSVLSVTPLTAIFISLIIGVFVYQILQMVVWSEVNQRLHYESKVIACADQIVMLLKGSTPIASDLLPLINKYGVQRDRIRGYKDTLRTQMYPLRTERKNSIKYDRNTKAPIYPSLSGISDKDTNGNDINKHPLGGSFSFFSPSYNERSNHNPNSRRLSPVTPAVTVTVNTGSAISTSSNSNNNTNPHNNNNVMGNINISNHIHSALLYYSNENSNNGNGNSSHNAAIGNNISCGSSSARFKKYASSTSLVVAVSPARIPVRSPSQIISNTQSYCY